MVTFSELHTPNGHACGEVTSALQKSIRRSDERSALYWASELDLAGYGNYAFKRLRIIATEDVGLADPTAALTVRCLYENWLDQRKAEKGDTLNTAIFLVHAVLVLARAKKSRICDHALMCLYEGEREPLEIPDYALDQHTARGRQMGRGLDHFFDEGTLLVGEELDDPYRNEGLAARARGKVHQHMKVGPSSPTTKS
jgi:replication-associated recombination protein RarA